MACRRRSDGQWCARANRALGALTRACLSSTLLVCGFAEVACDDGVVQPIRAESSSAGGRAASLVAGGGTGVAGLAGDSTAPCAMLDWPSAALEDEASARINEWRETGVFCGGGFGDYVLPLTTSETLRCAARVHSVTRFKDDVLTTAATRLERYSAPPAWLDVPTYVDQIVFEGGPDCENLLDPAFSVVGVGFASDATWGYWTIYLASS